MVLDIWGYRKRLDIHIDVCQTSPYLFLKRRKDEYYAFWFMEKRRGDCFLVPLVAMTAAVGVEPEGFGCYGARGFEPLAC
jgi:hypothetical protein